MTNGTSYLKRFCGFALVLAVSTHSASAWLRLFAPDDELVQQSDAIVVGHVEASFTPVEIPSGNLRSIVPSTFHFMEYRTTLVITKTLAGKIQVGPTPLIIHYGIKPVVLKTNPSIQDTFNPPAADQNTGPAIPVGIYDSATSCIGGPPSDDIRKDHIWFLRAKGQSVGGVEEDTSSPGIWSPQDVQPLDRKPCYVAIIAGDIDALTPFTLGDSYPAKEAVITQDRMKVMRIAKISDPSARCDQLLPFYIKGAPYSNAGQLAFDQIIACGSLGAAKLIPLFQNPPNPNFELGTILSGWRKANFKESVPLIIDWLTKEDQRWSSRTRDDQIYASREGPKGGEPYHDPRSVSFRNMYSAIEVLDDFHATESKALIQRIRDRWAGAAPFLPNNDFLKTCDDALADLK